MIKIAIIGDGLSGLSVAHLLKDHSEITIFEKARGVSGRMSTREAKPYFFDLHNQCKQKTGFLSAGHQTKLKYFY